MIGVVKQARHVEAIEVVELFAGHVAQHRLDVVDGALDPLVALKDIHLRRLKHAVKSAQHRQGQDHLAVLRLLVVAAQ